MESKNPDIFLKEFLKEFLMDLDTTNLILILGCLGFIGMVIAYSRSTQASNRLEQRLDSVVERRNHDDPSALATGVSSEKEETLMDQFFQLEAKLVKSIAGATREASRKYQAQFDQAGWPSNNAPVIVLTIRILSFLVGIILSAGLYQLKDQLGLKNPLMTMTVILLVFLVTLRAYDFLIDIFIKQRYKRIEKSLSSSVDLLSICIRAGYSLDKAFEIIAEEVSYYNMDLCVELMKVSIELSVIPNRQEALRNFTKRVDLPLTKILVTGLIQSEEQGASLGQTLTYLSQEFSKQKIAAIDERATRIPTMILLPMAFFCLPGFLVFLMGPIAANIARSGFLNQ
jgi:tight adherence protein C